jgi:hypothetical protein
MPNRININSIEEFNRLTGTTYDASLKNYNFEDYEFTIELNLKEANYFNFKNCVFKEDVKFPYRTHRDSSLAESTFEKKANFDNTSFEDNIRFYETKFKGETSFNNTKFKKLADFWNAKFEKITIFFKTDFLGTTVFSSTTFKENILFSYSLIDKLAIFRGTIFEKGFDFSLAIIPGELSIFDIKVDIKAFKDVKDTDNVIEFAENVSENGVITRKNKRESFRILKNKLNEKQNSIDALEFAKYEMNSYAKQLEQNVFEDKKIRDLQNLLLLYINTFSSKHGTSWWRGVKFTFGIGLLFFYLSIIATDNYIFGFCNLNDFTTCVKYFFTFILPTHGIGYLDSENPKMFYYLWDFLGRIFVSYGIYQTIQAFRKYKNK